MGRLIENRSLLLVMRENIVWTPPDVPALEEIVDSLCQTINKCDLLVLKCKLSGLRDELRDLYTCCVEDGDVESCMSFLCGLYKCFTWKELDWKRLKLRIYKAKNNYLVMITGLDEDDELVFRACLRADGEVRREDFIEYVRKKLRESPYGKYYTVEDLKPLVSKLWSALAERGVIKACSGEQCRETG